jgi:antitoxin CcdA
MRMAMRIACPRLSSALADEEISMAAPVRERPPAKKPVNLSIDRDLLQEARSLKVNLSKALEERLHEIVRQERARRWQEDNREAIEAYNRFIDKYGLFNDIRKRL